MRGYKAGINAVNNPEWESSALRWQLMHRPPLWCHVHPLDDISRNARGGSPTHLVVGTNLGLFWSRA